MGISHTVDGDGIAEVVMDNPPVNALTVAGWFELADTVRGPRRRPARPRRDPAGRGQGLQRRRRHQGDAAHRGLRRPRRRQPRLLRRLRRRVRVRGAGHRRRPRLLPRRRHRPRRQRRHHRRHDDATFGLPEVDRGALGAATHLARLVPQHKMRAMVYTATTVTAQELHHYGSVLAVVEPDRLRDAAFARRPRDRREEPDRDPRGQGVAQRHRPRRRQAVVPVRAGLHVRAQPLRRRRRSPRRVRRQARSPIRASSRKHPCRTSG